MSENPNFYPQNQPAPQPPWATIPQPTPQQTSGLAVASLVLGIVWLGWLGSVLAVIFGHIALRQARDPRVGGRGLAIAGLVLGYIGIATLVWFLIALGSFAGSVNDSSSISPPSTITDTQVDNSSSTDETYLAFVHDQSPAVAAVPDATLIGVAHSICSALDNGAGVADLFLSAENVGLDSDTAGVVAGAAIGAYCPEYGTLLN